MIEIYREVIINPLETGIRLSTVVDICESEVKKFQQNLKTIHNIEMDLNITVSESNQQLLIVRNITPQICIREKDIEAFKNAIAEFMKTFHNIPFESKINENTEELPSEEEIAFVKDLLELDTIGMGFIIFHKDGFVPGSISPELLKRMVNAYLEKYGES